MRGPSSTDAPKDRDQDRVHGNKAFLRLLPLFADLGEADLDHLCRMARRIRVDAGEVVMREGEPGDGLYVVVKGRLEVTKREAGRDVILAVRGRGEVLGEMALLEQAPRTATVRAVDPAELMVIAPEDFRSLLSASPEAAAHVLRMMAGRLRSTEAALMEQARLASLGTLAAGLAHELNNPAAAIARATDHMADALETLRRRAGELATLRLSNDETKTLGAIHAAIADAGPPAADSLACSIEEERLGEWLEGRGVDEPWDLAPPLVAYGFDTARVADVTGAFNDSAIPVVLRWLGAALAARGLLHEIAVSSRSISDIVRAVRSYTYLDQAPVQDVDIRATVEDTLVILRHRIGPDVVVERDFAPDLPAIEAFGSEINQVWTNLIANALDAMDGSGALRIEARADLDDVVVRITDTGPGISADIRDRIFDPFFTTRAPGGGTGLGLHIVHNIVVNRHRGRITVRSEPGATTFEVRLPVRLARNVSESRTESRTG